MYISYADICTLVSLCGFGEGRASGNLATDESHYMESPPAAKTLEEFATKAGKVISDYNKGKKANNGLCQIHNLGWVQAVTIDRQPLAEKHLRELGFKSSTVQTRKYQLHKTTLWLIHPMELIKNLEKILGPREKWYEGHENISADILGMTEEEDDDFYEDYDDSDWD